MTNTFRTGRPPLHRSMRSTPSPTARVLQWRTHSAAAPPRIVESDDEDAANISRPVRHHTTTDVRQPLQEEEEERDELTGEDEPAPPRQQQASQSPSDAEGESRAAQRKASPTPAIGLGSCLELLSESDTDFDGDDEGEVLPSPPTSDRPAQVGRAQKVYTSQSHTDPAVSSTQRHRQTGSTAVVAQEHSAISSKTRSQPSLEFSTPLPPSPPTTSPLPDRRPLPSRSGSPPSPPSPPPKRNSASLPSSDRWASSKSSVSGVLQKSANGSNVISSPSDSGQTSRAGHSIARQQLQQQKMGPLREPVSVPSVSSASTDSLFSNSAGQGTFADHAKRKCPPAQSERDNEGSNSRKRNRHAENSGPYTGQHEGNTERSRTSSLLFARRTESPQNSLVVAMQAANTFGALNPENEDKKNVRMENAGAGMAPDSRRVHGGAAGTNRNTPIVLTDEEDDRAPNAIVISDDEQ